ncbi:hypothetical protein Hanom_Chr06g00523111 [Helianthus anomalus]
MLMLLGVGGDALHVEHEDPPPILPNETLGDYYYHTYVAYHVETVLTPIWKLKQGDTCALWPTNTNALKGCFPY